MMTVNEVSKLTGVSIRTLSKTGFTEFYANICRVWKDDGQKTRGF